VIYHPWALGCFNARGASGAKGKTDLRIVDYADLFASFGEEVSRYKFAADEHKDNRQETEKGKDEKIASCERSRGEIAPLVRHDLVLFVRMDSTDMEIRLSLR
jgi:hypothetical protein